MGTGPRGWTGNIGKTVCTTERNPVELRFAELPRTILPKLALRSSSLSPSLCPVPIVEWQPRCLWTTIDLFAVVCLSSLCLFLCFTRPVLIMVNVVASRFVTGVSILQRCVVCGAIECRRVKRKPTFNRHKHTFTTIPIGLALEYMTALSTAQICHVNVANAHWALGRTL